MAARSTSHSTWPPISGSPWPTVGRWPRPHADIVEVAAPLNYIIEMLFTWLLCLVMFCSNAFNVAILHVYIFCVCNSKIIFGHVKKGLYI